MANLNGKISDFMKIKNIILQCMDLDYQENINFSEVYELSQSTLNREEDPFYYTIHLNSIGSSTPTLFACFKKEIGCFLSFCYVNNNEATDYIWEGSQLYNTEKEIEFECHDYDMTVPAKYFMDVEGALRCIEYFCTTGDMHSEFTWVRYDELDREFHL